MRLGDRYHGRAIGFVELRLLERVLGLTAVRLYKGQGKDEGAEARAKVEVTEMAVTGTDSGTDSGLSGGALAGIVIGVLLAVLVAVGVFWKKKKLAGVVIPATKMATKESAAA